MNRAPFAPDEWYHCFTRGVEKRKTFLSASDCERFLELLYISNATERLHRSDLLKMSHEEIFTLERGETLVDIGAFALMPNHFHILIRERLDSGITTFMRKLGTAYTMYFNIKHARTGNLFVKPFRSRHVADDAYLGKVFSYIHLNPLELAAPDWTMSQSSLTKQQEHFLENYPYSSMAEYVSKTPRAVSNILSSEAHEVFAEHIKPAHILIREGREYFAEFPER